MQYEEQQSQQSTLSSNTGFGLETGVSTEISTDIGHSVDHAEKTKKNTNNKPPEEEAKELHLKFGNKYTELSKSIIGRLYKDEALVKALMNEVGNGQSDNLSIAMFNALYDTDKLAVTEIDILQMLYDAVDDGWTLAVSRQALIALKDRLKLNSQLPKLDYHLLAEQLKVEFSKPDKSAINRSAVEQVFDKIGYNTKALNHLKLCYEGNLLRDAGGTEWALLFMLEEVDPVEEEKEQEAAPDETPTSLSGELILQQGGNTGSGKSFVFLVGENDSLWAIGEHYRVPVQELRKLNNLPTKGDPTLQPGQEIKMPINLFLPPNETITVFGKNGSLKQVKNPGGYENQEAKLSKEEREQIIAHIQNRTAIAHRKSIIETLSKLQGSEIAISHLRTDYYNTAGVPIEEGLRSAFWSGRKGIYYKEAYQAILSMLKVDDVSADDQRQHLVNKYKEEIAYDGDIELWKGLSIEQLVDRAYESLQPALNGEDVKVDPQKLLSPLASLRFKKANINKFLEVFESNHGSFFDNMQQASENHWDEYQMSPYAQVSTLTKLPIYSLSRPTIQAANAYLTDNLSVSEAKVDILEVQTADKQLKTDNFGFPILKGQFDNGSFIKYQEKADSWADAFYVVKPGDQFNKIAYMIGSSPSELNDLNPVLYIGKPQEVPGLAPQQPERVIHPGDIIKVPLRTLGRKPFAHVIGTSVYSEDKADPKKEFLEGGVYEIHAESYNPYLIEDLLNSLLAPKKGTGTGSLSFKVGIYIKGTLAFMINFEAGLEGLLKAEVGDDRWFQITSKVQFYIEAGIEAVGSMRKNFTILGQTNMFQSIKHFATHFNHDVYNLMLGNNQVMRAFLDYWDDADRQENLSKEYYGAKTDALTNKDAIKEVTQGTTTYQEKDAPDYVGDTHSSSENKRSNDLEKEEGGTFLDIVLYNSDFLTVTYSQITDNMNSDNVGTWLFIELNFTVQNIKSLIKDLKDPAKFMDNPSADKIDAAVGKLFPGITNYVKSLKSLKGVVNPKTYKSTFNKLKEDNFGESGTKTKVNADAGIVLDFCFQNVSSKDSPADWVPQYARTSIMGSLEVDKEKLLWTNGAVAVSGGIKFEAKYQRSLYEKPASESIGYISTLYNGFMLQKESDTVKETRKQVYKEAQDKRVKEGDAEAEAQAIKKYWASYQNKSATYYTNDMWEAYKKEHRDPLNELFKNFLILLLKNKDKKWSDIDGIEKFISPENAGKYLGKTPVEGLIKMFKIEDNKFLDRKNEFIIDELKSDKRFLEKFEKNILFNLYKEQQKHEFDYFFYKAENKNK